MEFNSSDFLIFFPIVVLVYFVIPCKLRYLWLLVASYYFYMNWNPKYAILMGISTIITYLSGIMMEHADNINYKKGVVALSFITNIGILIFFKYSNFIVDNLNILTDKMGMQSINHFDIILPVGISFYTFQALSYTVDVYRREIKAEKNILRYALFVSFFPQLVAGPIERSKNLLWQIESVDRYKMWSMERISNGLMLMTWGFFQKMVIADRISIFVESVYSQYWLYGTVELSLATIFFALQIYCDFGSYSLIAIGAAKVMGFELMENFNTPYFAMSIKDFWRRWHISLSTWFRDYLYIPLGGSRCSQAKKYRNLMIVFLVSGLWHGANWGFIVWGGLHGIYQIVGEISTPIRKKIISKLRVNSQCMSFYFGKMVITFILVCFAWVFFRMDTLYNSVMFIKRIFTEPNWWVVFDQSLYTLGLDKMEMDVLVFSLLVLLLVDLIRYKKGVTIDLFLREQNTWFRWGVLISLFVFVIVYGVYGPSYDPTQFIYFQF